jgi:hypothetical protein
MHMRTPTGTTVDVELAQMSTSGPPGYGVLAPEMSATDHACFLAQPFTGTYYISYATLQGPDGDRNLGYFTR